MMCERPITTSPPAKPPAITTPTVTIVVTTYNHAHFLARALDSIRAQTVAVDEVVVVDDGSRDDPAAVVAQYPEARLIRQANQGLAAARNTGLQAASGTFIGFLDADDELLPRMVEVNLGQFARNPDCAFVYGTYRLIDAATGNTRHVTLRTPGSDAYAGFLSGNLVGMHGTVLYRREILLEEGGFDPALRAVEDYDVYLRLAHKHPVAAHEEPLAAYHRHTTNMSNDTPFMLERALAVHRRHRETAATRPDWQEAFRLGEANWQGHYVRQQINKLKQALRTRRNLLGAVASTLRVARLAPGATARELRVVPRKLHARIKNRRPAPGRVRFGDLRRTTPIDPHFGYGRGKPVDRHYIEAFLAAHAADIRGRVLEIGDSAYTRQFGGDRVTQADVLNRYPGHPETTFVGDLVEGADLPSDAFDCIVLTQTLHLLFDMQTAVATLERVLRPGGVLLITVPWVSQIDRGEWGGDWMWSISPKALERLLNGPFPTAQTQIDAYGNVLAATAFIHGLAEHELRAAELDVHDPFCPVLVTGRAVKATAA